MKKLIQRFSKLSADQANTANGNSSSNANDRAQIDNPSRGKLNEQLTKKSRHPSLIPGSFYDREQKFKATPPPPIQTTQPRTSGYCQVKQGTFDSRKLAWCGLQGHWLYLCPRTSAPLENTDIEAMKPHAFKRIDLVGSHLSASHVGELVIKEAEGGATTFYLPPDERNQWMVGLSKVPGLFRRVDDYYALGKTWGHGATCIVQEAINKFTGRKLAVKSRLHKTRDATAAMHNELRILQICAKSPHPAIPTLEDYFFDEDGTVELVMELMEGGELFDWIAAKKRFTEDEAKEVFRQIVDGVAHLHSLGIAHRDLKPENLMYLGTSLDSQQIKIMDYDLAKVNFSPEWQGRTPCGSTHFMAPEIVLQQEYSLAIDMWSLGVILYILLCGRMPFHGKDEAAVEGAILGGQYEETGEMWTGVSGEAKDLVHQLLQRDPEARPSAQECLHHPWLSAPHKKQNGLGIVAGGSVELQSPQRLRDQASTLTDGPTRLSTRQVLGLNMNTIREHSRELSATKRRFLPTGVSSPSTTGFDLDKVRLSMDLAAAGGGERQRGGLVGGSPNPSYLMLSDALKGQGDQFADIAAFPVEEVGYMSDDGGAQ